MTDAAWRPALFALAAALALPSAAEAGRPMSTEMSCAQATALVSQRGGLVMSTGASTYERYVVSRTHCLAQQDTVQGFAPTLDDPRCPVGYLCIDRRKNGDN